MKETRYSRRKEKDDRIRRSKPRRESRFDERQSGRTDRRNDRRLNQGDDRHVPSGWNNNRAYDHSRRVTLASVSMEDLRTALDEPRGSRKTNLYDSSSDGSAREYLSDYGPNSYSDLMKAGAEVSQIPNLADRQDHPRSHVLLVLRSDKTYTRRERVGLQEWTDSSQTSHVRTMRCMRCHGTRRSFLQATVQVL